LDLALRPLTQIPVEHHIPLPEEQYGKLVPIENMVNRFPCCVLIPSKLPANITLQRVRGGGIMGTASTTLIYSDGLKIIQRPVQRSFGVSRLTAPREGFPKMNRFSYSGVDGSGHDPWSLTLANGTTFHHKGHLSFWLDEPQWLYELIGDHSFAELRDMATSMLQSLEGRPVPDEIRGKSVSLSEASDIAEKAGFRIRLPSYIPTGFKLTDVRVTERYISSLEDPQLETLVRLIYSKESLPANATASDLIESGGFVLTLKKRGVVGYYEGLYKLTKGHEVEVAERVSIRGYECGGANCYYSAWTGTNVQILQFFDEEMEFQIIASSKEIDKQQLIAIAESIP